MAAEIENDYLFHNDNELTRLALQHVIIKDATKGKQVFAPISFDGSPLQILDACTGDGLWIRDLQASIAPNDSQHSYTGTDIEVSYFPKEPPANTSYHVQDITKPWPADWNGKFDLIHQRLALVVPGSEENTIKALKGYVDLLKPGGWIQLVEVRQWTKETDGQAFKDLNVCLADMIKTIGASLTHIDNAKSWLESLGLVDVQEETVEANYGTREDKKAQEIAKRSILTTAGSILGITSTFPQQLLTLPQERVVGIKDDLESEFNKEPVSAHWQYKIVWGRKGA
ncbi:hypothetical protein BU24DRAFT_423370 [Aaosphaeria arxii CBS 175.79]|uniref:Methyltransferase domain-containing protein n=1 Tax=Aaosphaeria arxii CBS 175.79 TaxID=1450172 RepID=A0A6A5XMR8_9PLEO|nr:uncharacterized protein BU24DRAFT_423370 [Aaosphaeria arxii CBS 175.79]KAF2014412.1 hypothetical protein BU24DRAFT_423370 [Aaosphaeria arxii CBS 175.79]